MKKSAIPALLGIAGIGIHFIIVSDFASVFPYLCFFSVPLLINLFLSASIDRLSAHLLNNFSAALYILLFFTAAWSDSYLVSMILLGTPFGLLLLILFPTLWIVTWWKRDSERPF